jgi:CcmD family protein
MLRSKTETSGFARVGGWVTAVAGFALGTAAFAAQQSQGEFVPLKPGDMTQETLPATPLVYGAYAFVWVALAAYVFLLWRRLGRVERELAEVNARLASKR